MKAALISLNEGDMYKETPLGQICRIGRSEDNDLTLPKRYISRRHALVSYVNGQYVIKDLGSKNPVLINSHPIQEHILQNGDIIEICDFKFRFQYQPTLPPRTHVEEDIESTAFVDPTNPGEGTASLESIQIAGAEVETVDLPNPQETTQGVEITFSNSSSPNSHANNEQTLANLSINLEEELENAHIISFDEETTLPTPSAPNTTSNEEDSVEEAEEFSVEVIDLEDESLVENSALPPSPPLHHHTISAPPISQTTSPPLHHQDEDETEGTAVVDLNEIMRMEQTPPTPSPQPSPKENQKKFTGSLSHLLSSTPKKAPPRQPTSSSKTTTFHDEGTDILSTTPKEDGTDAIEPPPSKMSLSARIKAKQSLSARQRKMNTKTIQQLASVKSKEIRRPPAKDDEDGTDIVPISTAKDDEDGTDIVPISTAKDDEDGTDIVSIPAAEHDEDDEDGTDIVEIIPETDEEKESENPDQTALLTSPLSRKRPRKGKIASAASISIASEDVEEEEAEDEDEYYIDPDATDSFNVERLLAKKKQEKKLESFVYVGVGVLGIFLAIIVIFLMQESKPAVRVKKKELTANTVDYIEVKYPSNNPVVKPYGKKSNGFIVVDNELITIEQALLPPRFNPTIFILNPHKEGKYTLKLLYQDGSTEKYIFTIKEAPPEKDPKKEFMKKISPYDLRARKKLQNQYIEEADELWDNRDRRGREENYVKAIRLYQKALWIIQSYKKEEGFNLERENIENQLEKKLRLAKEAKERMFKKWDSEFKEAYRRKKKALMLRRLSQILKLFMDKNTVEYKRYEIYRKYLPKNM
ncbi:MAG: FHA domain-containing protein [Planctomycetota bacterium]|nr:MAG: FHA domain-containing protein [Planctomycetota bacterium]